MNLIGVWMRCGAACGQGLRMQGSMQMNFLLSAPSLVKSTRKLKSSKSFVTDEETT